MATMMIVLAAACSHPWTISCGSGGDGLAVESHHVMTPPTVGESAVRSVQTNKRCALFDSGVISDDTVIRVSAVGQAPGHVKGARARLMARRGGEVSAMARIAEAINAPNGVLLTGVRFVAYRDQPDGSCVVTAELRIR